MVHEIAVYMETNTNAYSSSFLHAFFPTGANYASGIKTVYKNLADIADQSAASGYIVEVTCASTKKCGGGYMLHMDDIYTKGNTGKTVATMNFCPGADKFFNTATAGENVIIGTQRRVAELKAGAGKDMSNFLKLAHRSRAIALLHELTHTNYATSAGVDVAPEAYQKRYDMAKDFAYGLQDCLQLAKGTFNRVPGSRLYLKKPAVGPVYCGASKAAGGICPAAVAMINADSYGFLAAGVWFSHQIGKALPVPVCATTSSKRFGTLNARAANPCAAASVDVIDDPADQGAKVAAS